jgi:hypothetical protein
MMKTCEVSKLALKMLSDLSVFLHDFEKDAIGIAEKIKSDMLF